MIWHIPKSTNEDMSSVFDTSKIIQITWKTKRKQLIGEKYIEVTVECDGFDIINELRFDEDQCDSEWLESKLGEVTSIVINSAKYEGYVKANNFWDFAMMAKEQMMARGV